MNKSRLILAMSLFVVIYSAIIPQLGIAQVVSEEARRHMSRGQAAIEMAKSPEELAPAIKEFSEAARLAPDWPDPYFNLALVQEKTGKLKEAVASLKEYLRLAPNGPDTAKIRDRLYKLEYRAEQTLSVADIVDVLVSGFSMDRSAWKVATQDKPGVDIPGGSGRCGGTWQELYFTRIDRDSIKALNAVRYYPVRSFYQTLTVTGPLLKYITIINVCDESANKQLGGCDAVTQQEIEVVSKKLVRVKQTVLRGGSGAGVATGDKTLCIFQKKD